MKICLISSVHPWVNPRLVKEADALTAAGHEVTAVTKAVDGWADERDRRLLASKPWRSVRVNLIRHDRAGYRPWLKTAARSALAARAYQVTGSLRLAEQAYYRGFDEVLRAAVDAGAELYMAHTQGALPIAARAARATHARYGFDCEDLLAQESADGGASAWRRRVIGAIERAYLPGAGYVTTTSRAMAAHLERTYQIPSPHVVYNTWPLAALDGVQPPRHRARRPMLELVWISASIGPGRGLDDALAALARVPAARLTVFGRMLPSFEAEFEALTRQYGVAARTAVRPVVEPDDILPTLARFDVGLSLERTDSLNRTLTIANKTFQYLQAGLAIAATGTEGHREVFAAGPAVGFMYEPGDATRLAESLQAYAADPARRLAAQEAAWTAGQHRYNWERDRERLADAIGLDLAPSPAAATGTR